MYYACVEVSKQLAGVGSLLQHVGPGVSNSEQQVPLPTKPFCWYQKNQSLCQFIHRPPPAPPLDLTQATATFTLPHGF